MGNDKRDERGKPTQLPAEKNRDGQPLVRLATPGEEPKIKRDARKGDLVNRADEDANDIERCRTAKDRETHTRLATPAEEKAIKAKHAKDRAEAAPKAVEPLSEEEQQEAADEAAASVARRQALGGV